MTYMQSQGLWAELEKAFDLAQPDWYITFANGEELKGLAYSVKMAVELPATVNPMAGIQWAIHSLRRSVARRLDMPVRAAVHVVKEV